jgi:hypothetical protein
MNPEIGTTRTEFLGFHSPLPAQIWDDQNEYDSRFQSLARTATTSLIPQSYGTIASSAVQYVSSESGHSVVVLGRSQPELLTYANQLLGMTNAVTVGSSESDFSLVGLSNLNRVIATTRFVGNFPGVFFPEAHNTVVVGYAWQAPNATSGFATTHPLELLVPQGNRLELEVLLANEQGDWATPTLFAYTNARAILEKGVNLPVALMTTDSEGGIRMAWRRGEKQVRVNFGAWAELKSYIYYASPQVHEVEKLDAANLLKRLDWLTRQ